MANGIPWIDTYNTFQYSLPDQGLITFVFVLGALRRTVMQAIIYVWIN